MFRLIPIAIIMLLLPVTAFADDDFEIQQLNFKVKVGNIELENRQELNSDKDHIQLGYSIGDTTFQFRHTDADNAENRLRFTTELFKTDYFYGKMRGEYRHFEDTDDYFRIRPILGVYLLNDASHRVRIEYQPSFNFEKENEKNDLQIDSGQVKLAYRKQVHAFAYVEPYIQYDHDGDFDKKQIFLGTSFVINF